jgi:hypothetical protein
MERQSLNPNTNDYIFDDVNRPMIPHWRSGLLEYDETTGISNTHLAYHTTVEDEKIYRGLGVNVDRDMTVGEQLQAIGLEGTI